MSTGKVPVEFRILNHGINNEQYFQGHGVSFTKFKECATGIGHTPSEAFEDALDSLAQNGWDTDTIRNSEEGKKTLDDKRTNSDLDAEGFYWYVSVDVK